MLDTRRIENILAGMAIVSATGILSGCTTVEHKTKVTKTFSVSQARYLVTSNIGRAVCKSDNVFTCSNYESPNVKLGINSIEIDGNYRYELAPLNIVVLVSSWPGRSVFLIFNDGMAILEDQNGNPGSANTLSDALLTLKKVAVLNDEEIGDESDAAFQDVVVSLRSAATKPTIPENARMYKLQAEDAIRNKEFEEAAYRYSEALKVAPWFAQAHFNRALVLGEINEFGFAVKEMKRYLALVPDAPDASAAQKQIYIWQGKVDTLN